MTPKDPFLEGTCWNKFWRPIRSRALLFTPDTRFTTLNCLSCGGAYQNLHALHSFGSVSVTSVFLTFFSGAKKDSQRQNLSGPIQRMPKGGAKRRGGQNLTRRPPVENSFRPPLTSVRFAPPYPISLSKSLRSAQNFPQLTSSETIFGGSRKAASDGPSSRGFAFRYVLPPPFSSAQPISRDIAILSLRYPISRDTF